MVRLCAAEDKLMSKKRAKREAARVEKIDRRNIKMKAKCVRRDARLNSVTPIFRRLSEISEGS